jgi:Protein of unknown function (DUF1524)
MLRRLVVLVFVALGLVAVPAAAAHAEDYSAPLSTALAELPVATEVRTGYDRDLFRHWVDADGDGCNARYEVLIAEAEVAPSVGSRCRLTGGRWFSYYDRVSWTDPGRIDIDHLVPLAEAWDSGAGGWTSTLRQSYANDLDDLRTLVGVTDSVNQAKGDQDPATWLPTYDRCRYLDEWVAVKVRWRLTVDTTEKSALTALAAGCPDTTITVTRAY